MPRSTLGTNPGSGPLIETWETPLGVHIPATVLRAFNDAGDPVDLKAENDGSVRTANYLWNGTSWDRLRGDAVGGIRTQQRPDTVATATLTTVGNEVAAAVATGMRAASFTFNGTFAGLNIAPEVSFDGGATWMALPSVRSSAPSFGVVAGSINVGASPGIIDAVIPAGSTNVRLRVVAISSGSVAATLGQSSQAFAPPWTVLGNSVALGSGGSTIGVVYRRGVWQDDTATALAAAGTFTGSSRDVVQASAGASNFGTGTAGVDLCRFIAVSDVAGTLAIEISRDNTTWRRIWEEPTSNASTGGLHVAEVEIKPATRYVRAVYVNGAAAQGHFLLQSMLLS